MGLVYRSLLAAGVLAASSSLTHAVTVNAVLDFEGLSGVGLNQAIPTLTFGQLQVSFTNLELVGSGSDGGWASNPGADPQHPSKLPSNTVVTSDRAYYSGNSISGWQQDTAGLRPFDFTRSIAFNIAVDEVSLTLADVDFPITNPNDNSTITETIVELYDANGLFDTISVEINSNDALGDGSNFVSGDGRAIPVTFSGAQGITRIDIIGGDPLGIDNIRFRIDEDDVELDLPGISPVTPVPAPGGLLGLTLMLLGARRISRGRRAE